MSRESNVEADGTFWGKVREYIKNEPARSIEHLRSILLALAAIGFVTLEEEVFKAIIAVGTIGVSILAQEKGVRNVVTPYWKVEEGVFNAGVKADIDDYEILTGLPEDE